MTVYGDSFATATLMDNAVSIEDGELSTGEDAYFRIPLTHASNRTIITLDVITASVGLTVYDLNEVQLDTYYNGNDVVMIIEDAPVGDLFLMAHSYGGSSPGQFGIVAVSFNNGVGPPTPIVTTMKEINVPSQAVPYGTHTATIDSDIALVNEASGQGSWANGTHSQQDPGVHDRGTLSPTRGIIKVYENTLPHVSGDYGGQQYHLAGTVKNEGVNYADRVLRLYDRDSGKLIGETKSDNLGQWEFPQGLFENSKYYVIAFDDMNAPVLQAVIHDALIPIAD